jgi:hypothetical protein
LLLIEIQMQLRLCAASKRVQYVQEGRSKPRPGGVVELAGATQRHKATDHREQRRDADSAGDQNRMKHVLLQAKIIPRMRDRDDVADPQFLVNEAGAAPAHRVLVHGDYISVTLALVVHE